MICIVMSKCSSRRIGSGTNYKHLLLLSFEKISLSSTHMSPVAWSYEESQLEPNTFIDLALYFRVLSGTDVMIFKIFSPKNFGVLGG
jgi:hypothetical protein